MTEVLTAIYALHLICSHAAARQRPFMNVWHEFCEFQVTMADPHGSAGRLLNTHVRQAMLRQLQPRSGTPRKGRLAIAGAYGEDTLKNAFKAVQWTTTRAAPGWTSTIASIDDIEVASRLLAFEDLSTSSKSRYTGTLCLTPAKEAFCWVASPSAPLKITLLISDCGTKSKLSVHGQIGRLDLEVGPLPFLPSPSLMISFMAGRAPLPVRCGAAAARARKAGGFLGAWAAATQ